MSRKRPSATTQPPAQAPNVETLRHTSKVIGSGGPSGAVRSAPPSDRRRRTPRPPKPTDDDRPALLRRSPDKQQQGINFDVVLLEYARTAVIWMAHRHPEEPGSESLAALIDQAIRKQITEWESAHNGGKALPSL